MDADDGQSQGDAAFMQRYQESRQKAHERKLLQRTQLEQRVTLALQELDKKLLVKDRHQTLPSTDAVVEKGKTRKERFQQLGRMYAELDKAQQTIESKCLAMDQRLADMAGILVMCLDRSDQHDDVGHQDSQQGDQQV